MTKYHPLTERINNMSLRPLDKVDQIIREYLKEKAIMCQNNMPHARMTLAKEILDLKEETLEDKFRNDILGSAFNNITGLFSHSSILSTSTFFI